jgi:type I restriction enzyme, S subunit
MVTNKEQNKLNVPHLRFPEFHGEWEKHGLSEYLDFKNGLNPDSKRFGKGIKFISVMDILNNPVITYDCIRASVQATDAEISSFSVENGDILFQRSSETLEDVGRANVYIDDKVAVFGGFVIRGKKKANYNPLFFRYLLSSPYARKRIIPMGAGAQHFNIGQEGLSKVLLNFPSIEEQTKIASLLHLLDERIATQSKLIEKLESLIKGIMVELQKQGVNKGTWKKVFLSDVLTERNERNTNLFQVFSVSVSQGIVNQVDYLGRSFAAKDTSKYNVVHYGDLVYTKSPTGSFPYGIVKQSLSLENVAVSPLYGVYKPQSLAVGAYLHEYFMSEINTHNYLHPLIQKGAKNTINITNQRFLENCVLLPTNINELLQISKLLRSLNNKIKYQQDILQQYQKQKKYLLRQMFI